MSDKRLNINASENENAQNAEDDDKQEVNDTNNIAKNVDSNEDRESANPKTKAVDIKTRKDDGTLYTTYDNSHTNDAKTEAKKELSQSNIDVVDYLKSEFVGLNTKDIIGQEATDKLPKYSEIDKTGYSRKYIDKHTEVWKYSRGKKHRLFLNEPIVVQIMGSENLPQNKVVMVYEPETRNYTVKGMFVMLMLLHLFTWIFTFSIWACPAREGFVEYGHYICIIPFLIEIIIIILSACFQVCRYACCACCSSFSVVLFHSIGCASFSGYLNIRLFCNSYLVLTFTDIVCIIVGCSSFNFTSKKLYIIELSSGLIFLVFTIPALDSVFSYYFYYWEDPAFKGDNIVSEIFNFIFTFAVIIFSVAQLHLLLAGEWVELGEDDYSFGGYLMYVSPIDFPIRMLRKFGAFNSCDKGDDEEEE